MPRFCADRRASPQRDQQASQCENQQRFLYEYTVHCAMDFTKKNVTYVLAVVVALGSRSSQRGAQCSFAGLDQ